MGRVKQLKSKLFASEFSTNTARDVPKQKSTGTSKRSDRYGSDAASLAGTPHTHLSDDVTARRYRLLITGPTTISL